MWRNLKSVRLYLAFFAYIIVYYILPINTRLLWQPNETRDSEIIREMLASGHWFAPQFLGLHDGGFDLPWLWFSSIGQWVFGTSNFAVRAGAIFATLLMAALVAGFTVRLWQDKRTALIATLLFLSLSAVYSIGTSALQAPVDALNILLCLYCLWLGRASAKNGNSRHALCWFGLAGSLALLAWNSLTSLSVYQNNLPRWSVFPLLLAGSLPWLGLLPGALFSAWRGRNHIRGALPLVCLAVIPILLVSLSNSTLLCLLLVSSAPMAILMARYGLYTAPNNPLPLRVNGWINIAIGITGIIATFIVSSWGPMQTPLWTHVETYKVFCSWGIFIIWLCFGASTLNNSDKTWTFSALCPLGLVLLLGFSVPDRVMEYRQPQFLAEIMREPLESSDYILSDSVGIAAGLGWSLKRDDILIYTPRSEMPVAGTEGHIIRKRDFPVWLRQHREEGNITLILSDAENKPADLPPADSTENLGRLVLYQYRPTH